VLSAEHAAKGREFVWKFQYRKKKKKKIFGKKKINQKETLNLE